MTTFAPTPVSSASIGPVELRSLAWVAWRRNRATVLGLSSLLVALATYLLVTGLYTHAAYNDLGGCVPPITTDACRIRWESFVSGHSDRGVMGPLLLILPGVIGAIVGAPLIGRELESGVFRYSWTQGAGRMRWAAAVTIPIALLTTALMGLLATLTTWRNVPMVAAGSLQRLDSLTFPTTGVVGIGWTLLGLSAGILAGRLWRRVIPAVATSVAAWFGLAYLSSMVRPHLLAPLATAGEPPARSLDVADHWMKGGVRVSTSEVSSVVDKLGVQMTDHGFSAHVGKGGTAPTDPISYLSEHGYTYVHTYQPDSRFWTFQWIELGWLVLASVGLLSLTFWLVRRRST
jgi:hypothetical protein